MAKQGFKAEEIIMKMREVEEVHRGQGVVADMQTLGAGQGQCHLTRGLIK